MTARAPLALVVLCLLAGRAPAGPDKARLRKLATLPTVSITFGVQYSSTLGFSFNGDKPDPLVEIARVRKQFQGDASDAERYLRLGRLYSKAGRKKESEKAEARAVVLCRQAVKEHPEDMRWLAQLGDALVSTGEVEEGEKLLRRAIETAPDEWRAWLALGECVDGRALRALLGEEHFSLHLHDAKVLIPALVKHKPTKEQIAEMRKLWKEAAHCYDKAVKLAPNESKPYFTRIGSNWIHGAIEAGLGSIEGREVNMLAALVTPECAAAMSRVARLAPDDPRKVGSAVLLELLAFVINGKAEEKDGPPSFADFLKAKSRTLVDRLPAESRKSVKWGVERLKKLAKKSDKATAAAAAEILADVLMVMNMVDKEVTTFTMSSSREEDKAAEIVEHLSRAVVLDPSRDRAWDLLTMLLAEKKPSEAIPIARRRLAVKDNAHNRFYLAKVYADDEQFDKAAEELRAGLKDDSKDLNCHLGLIAALLKRDDAESLNQAGEQLDEVETQIKQEKSKDLKRNYQLLRGIHAALSAHPKRANELFRQILRQNKGNTSAAHALAALGEPLTPADRQLALDYLKKQGARIETDEDQPDSPVERIRFDRKSAEEDLFFLTAFPHLRELDLSGAAITDAGLAHLRGLTALEDLDLDSTKITDKGLVHLQPLRKLRVLSLHETKIGDAGLAQLENLKDLERLNISESSTGDEGRITAAGLAHLRKLTKLRDVSVGSYLTDEGLAHLAALPHLRKLFSIYCKISDDGMKHLERLTELEELWLSGTKITDAGAAHLKGLRNLRQLHLDHTAITDAGLAHLKGLTQLTQLELGDTQITDAGLVHLRGLTNLEDLNLSDRSRVLEKLLPTEPAVKVRITGAGLKHLQGLKKLHKLDLDGCSITDAGLSDIARLTQIEFLSLSTTDITDKGLAQLHQLKQLKFVTVSESKVTRKGIAELKKVFPKVEVLR